MKLAPTSRRTWMAGRQRYGRERRVCPLSEAGREQGVAPRPRRTLGRSRDDPTRCGDASRDLNRQSSPSSGARSLNAAAKSDPLVRLGSPPDPHSRHEAARSAHAAAATEEDVGWSSEERRKEAARPGTATRTARHAASSRTRESGPRDDPSEARGRLPPHTARLRPHPRSHPRRTARSVPRGPLLGPGRPRPSGSPTCS